MTSWQQATRATVFLNFPQPLLEIFSNFFSFIMTRLLFFCFCFGIGQGFLPVLLWHGMGDSCCEYGSLGRIITILKAKMPDTEILSLKFGDHLWQDIESGYFMNVNKQVQIACDEIKSNKNFKNGYNAIGFSQGGQFLRALAQRCPDPPMRKLISLGGQHQGVYGFPNCGQSSPLWCDYIRKLLNNGAYIKWVQDSLVQAEYWHDPLNEQTYRENSIFLADINNEKYKNMTYYNNLQKLEMLVLVLFEQDTMIIPRESSWFGFYAPGQSQVVLPVNETRLYKEDLIGLRNLINGGKVDFLSVDGNHLQFTEEWFIQKIVQRYLM